MHTFRDQVTGHLHGPVLILSEDAVLSLDLVEMLAEQGIAAHSLTHRDERTIEAMCRDGIAAAVVDLDGDVFCPRRLARWLDGSAVPMILLGNGSEATLVGRGRNVALRGKPIIVDSLLPLIAPDPCPAPLASA